MSLDVVYTSSLNRVNLHIFDEIVHLSVHWLSEFEHKYLYLQVIFYNFCFL